MSGFVTLETSEDNFTLSASQPFHLDTTNTIVFNSVTTFQAFTGAQYSGVEIFLLDQTNAQLLLNHQAFVGYLLDANNLNGLSNITVPAGQYWVGAIDTNPLSGSQTVNGFDEVSTLSLPGETFIGNVPMGVGGNAGAWKAQSFTITGAPDLFIETEGSGGKFMIMSDAEFSAFQTSYPGGFFGGTYSFLYSMGGQTGGPATELEGQLALPAGHYWLTWINDTGGWAGGAGDISGFSTVGASSSFVTGPGGNSGTPSVSAPILAAAFTNVLRINPTSTLANTATIVLADGSSVPNPAYQQAGTLPTLAAQVDASQTTLAHALNTIEHYGDATTSVATLAYQFFTTATPSSAGYDYLVNSAANPDNLNTAYYAKFNEENRYINFAENLGKVGAGKDIFLSNYGGLSLHDAMTLAYTTIFGFAPVGTKIADLLSAQITPTETRADYFASYGGDGLTGIGTKAAAVGWLMVEAVKADTGTYAHANDLFLADLAAGTAPYHVDLIGYYAGH